MRPKTIIKRIEMKKKMQTMQNRKQPKSLCTRQQDKLFDECLRENKWRKLDFKRWKKITSDE